MDVVTVFLLALAALQFTTSVREELDTYETVLQSACVQP